MSAIEKHPKPQKPRLRKQKRVALIIESSNAYGRNLQHGVISYIREHDPWSFLLIEQSRGESPPEWLANWRGDGIIARVENTRIAEAVTKAGVPAVDLSAGRFLPELPWIETNDLEIAELASEHFLKRGFKNFAYLGDNRFNWSLQRGDGFRRLIESEGFTCSTFDEPISVTNAPPNAVPLARWVDSLPKPVAIFSCYDIRGHQLLETCRNMGLSVPEEVAVLGVDNDDLLCELASPPLSSVVTNGRLAGFKAAALLDSMMNGQTPGMIETRVSPIGIRTRQSSDTLAVEDPLVAAAMRFIREHACDPIDVSDVVRVIPLSRRVLESRFAKLINRSPHEEILQVRLNRVRQLIAETDLKMDEIARRAGFEHTEYMSVVFRRSLGETPSQFRRRAKG